MSTNKLQTGDFIALRYDGTPDALYVYGHVTDDDANAAVQAECGNDFTIGPWVHKYARWSMEATEDGPGLVIRDHSEPGRGRFKVTVCDVMARRVSQSSRWHATNETSPSGRALFWCEACGVTSETPDKRCARGCGEVAP